MASNESREQSVQFSVNWTINWSELPQLSSWYHKKMIFAPSYNNVALLWDASLFVPSSDDDFSFNVGLCYLDGPIEKFKNMEYAISIMKPDLSIAKTIKRNKWEAVRGDDYGWEEYFDIDPMSFRAGFQESAPLVISITLKIPISVISFAPIASPSTGSPIWVTDLLAKIQDPEKSVFWNAKLISSDGAEFYCHKVVGYQSEPLQVMFQQPPADGKPENEYEFPQLGSASLMALVRYLYTGRADLVDLATTDLIELTDAARQYKLKPLKEACVVVLWKEVKNPDACGEILRFADLRNDLKHLKFRAMDVVAENYDTLLANDDNEDDMVDDFFQSARLRNEFLLFLSRRVKPNLGG